MLGRFAYATIIVEFAAQLATLGLKRGLAQQLAKTSRPHVHVVWDGLLVGWLVSIIAAGALMLWPVLLFPNSEVNGFDWLLPVTVFAWTGSDIALAGLAYRGDIGATVKARSLIEPWTISIAAFAFAFYSQARRSDPRLCPVGDRGASLRRCGHCCVPMAGRAAGRPSPRASSR